MAPRNVKSQNSADLNYVYTAAEVAGHVQWFVIVFPHACYITRLYHSS